MANRDGKGPQGKGPMTGKGMGACEGGKNLPIESGQGKRCGNKQHKGCGNRWTSLEETKEKVTTEVE